MRLFMITREDKGFTTFYEHKNCTPEEAMKQWQKGTSDLVGVSLVEIKESDLFSDKTFRNAWEYADGEFTINTDKAILRQKDVIRGACVEKVESLNKQLAPQSEIDAAKAEYNTLSAQCEGVTDLEKLKNILPKG